MRVSFICNRYCKGNNKYLKSYGPKHKSKYSSKGCVLEANLEYPKELQELLNNYPLAPDTIEISA